MSAPGEKSTSSCQLSKNRSEFDRSQSISSSSHFHHISSQTVVRRWSRNAGQTARRGNLPTCGRPAAPAGPCTETPGCWAGRRGRRRGTRPPTVRRRTACTRCLGRRAGRTCPWTRLRSTHTHTHTQSRVSRCRCRSTAVQTTFTRAHSSALTEHTNQTKRAPTRRTVGARPPLEHGVDQRHVTGTGGGGGRVCE